MDAEVDRLGSHPESEAGEQSGTGAGAAENVEEDAAFRKGLVNTDMGHAESATARRDVAECVASQESVQALDIRLVLKRNMVMHGHVPQTQPVGGAFDEHSASRMQEHKPAPRRRMDLE